MENNEIDILKEKGVNSGMESFSGSKEIICRHLGLENDSEQIDSNRLKKISLDGVYDALEEVQKKINDFQKALSEKTGPCIESKWYQLGTVNVKDVNQALNSIVSFTKESLNLISQTDNRQSENIKNICVLIALLAIAEGRLYSQFSELTEDSEAHLDNMVEIERHLNDIANNGENAADNIKDIAEAMVGILENKTREAIKLKASLMKWKEEQAVQVREQINLLKEDCENRFKIAYKSQEEEIGSLAEDLKIIRKQQAKERRFIYILCLIATLSTALSVIALII